MKPTLYYLFSIFSNTFSYDVRNFGWYIANTRMMKDSLFA